MKTREKRQSLRQRLMLSYLLVIVVTVGGVAALAGQLTVRQFRALVVQAGQLRAQGLALYFADYYQAHGSWDGVEEALTQLDQARWQPAGLRLEDVPFFPWRMPPPPWLSPETINRWVNLGQPEPDQLRLADASGFVIADNNVDWTDQSLLRRLRRRAGRTSAVADADRLSQAELARGAPVIIDDQVVGTVIVGAALGRLTDQQQAYVAVVWRRLLGLSMFAGIVAMVLSFGLAREIIKPVQALTGAARRLAAGDWDQKLPVQSEDELGEMTAAFNEMADQLTRQTRLRRQMVADMAHELRTPLSVLQLELEAQEDGLQSPAEATASLRGELDLLNQLVEDLHVLARTDAGELPLELEPTDLAALVDEIAARWLTHAATRRIRLTCQKVGHIPAAEADRTRVSQVLTNLLSNALRHTPEGGEINIKMSVVSSQSPLIVRRVGPDASRAANHWILIVITDTGEGIPQEDLPYVFERFYRVDRSRRRDTGGSGLGLAIAREAVELHGGRIWVESQEGAGSNFAFVLPASW